MSGLRFATNVAITVLTTLLISSIAYTASTDFHLVRTAEAPAPTSPVQIKESPVPVQLPIQPPAQAPASLYVIDQDLVDSSTGWMLVSDCPMRANPTCHNAVVSTQDAGLSWSQPVQVGRQYSVSDGDMPRSIRFVSRVDGFVYGAGGAFVTHDGGKTWSDLGIPAVFVDSIAMWGDEVWLATTPCPKGARCSDELRFSTDGGRTWSEPRQLPLNFIPENAAAYALGATLWMSVAPYGIETTTDLGRTWRTTNSACGQTSFNDFLATPNGMELWVVCWPYPDSNGAIASASVFVSEDGGNTWTPRSLPATLPLPGLLVTPRPDVAIEMSGQAPYVTHDGGRTWSRLLSDEGVSFTTIRFSVSGWGWALDGQRNVWSSLDGGDHWLKIGTLPDRLS